MGAAVETQVFKLNTLANAFEDVTYLWEYHMQPVMFSRGVKMLPSNVQKKERNDLKESKEISPWVNESSSFCTLARLRRVSRFYTSHKQTSGVIF